MAFYKEGRRVVHPLDPTLGEQFVELVEGVLDEGALDQLYNLTAGHRADYINPGELSWHNVFFMQPTQKLPSIDGRLENMSNPHDGARCCEHVGGLAQSRRPAKI